jgi:hypothetical protein
MDAPEEIAGTAGAPDQVQLTLRAAKLTAIAGLVYAVLFIVSLLLLTQVPLGNASDEEILAFYASEQRNIVILVALYLVPFAGIAFLWFIVVLRMWISSRVVRPVDALFSNIQLASGIIFLCLLFAAAAALSMTAVASELAGAPIDPVQAREFPRYGGSLFFVFATRMGAMFVFTTTNIARMSRILPPWFTVVGVVVGLFMLLSASFNRAMILVFPLWVLLLCLLILAHARSVSAARPGPGRVPAPTTPAPEP